MLYRLTSLKAFYLEELLLRVVGRGVMEVSPQFWFISFAASSKEILF